MMRPELATPGLQTSALAIELYSSEAIAGKELSLSSWCIASLYIYHFSTVIDFSSEKYSGSTVIDFSSEKYSTEKFILTVHFSTGTRSSCVQ